MIEIPIVALSVLSGFAVIGFAAVAGVSGFFLTELAQQMAIRARIKCRRWRRRA